MVKRKLKHGSSNCLSRLVHWLRYLMMMMMMMMMTIMTLMTSMMRTMVMVIEMEMVLVMVMVVLMMMVMVIGVVMAAAVTVHVRLIVTDKQFFSDTEARGFNQCYPLRFHPDAALCSICVLIPSSAL